MRAPHSNGPDRPLRVAWFSFFPIELQPDLPPELRRLSKQHPATWQSILLSEFENDARLELHVIVLRKDFPRSLTFRRNNITFHGIKTPGGLRAGSLYWIDTILIRRRLGQIKPDLVHAWGSEFGAAAVATRLPYRSVITMQGLLNWVKTISPLNRHQRISAFLEERALRRARFVTAESSFSMGYLGEHYPQLKLRQIEHAPHPLFHSVARNPQTRPVRIVCVSSFSHAKGADVLFSALAMLEGKLDYEVLWIGGKNGAFETKLRRTIPDSVWGRTSFKNDLTPTEIGDELARATFMVYPTRVDNSPNAVKEAVVAGVPVLASRIGGIVDYVFPGKNGDLFEAGRPELCSAAILSATKHPLFSQGLVDSATLADCRRYLSAETMREKFLSAYREVLDRP